MSLKCTDLSHSWRFRRRERVRELVLLARQFCFSIRIDRGGTRFSFDEGSLHWIALCVLAERVDRILFRLLLPRVMLGRARLRRRTGRASHNYMVCSLAFLLRQLWNCIEQSDE